MPHVYNVSLYKIIINTENTYFLFQGKMFHACGSKTTLSILTDYFLQFKQKNLKFFKKINALFGYKCLNFESTLKILKIFLKIFKTYFK